MAKKDTNSEKKTSKKNKTPPPESNERRLFEDLEKEFKPLTDLLDRNAEEIAKDLDQKPKKKSSKK